MLRRHTLNNSQLHISILLIHSKIAIAAAKVMVPKRADSPVVLLQVARKRKPLSMSFRKSLSQINRSFEFLGYSI